MPDKHPPIKNDFAKQSVYYAKWEKSAGVILSPFERFIHKETASSIILVGATILALILANSVFAALYYDITHIPFGLTLGPLTLEKELHHWVNDGLMALFFFVVGLELKREILVGELSSARKAALPIVAALGGMIVPALVYHWLNPDGLAARGWAIPMATDIAFAVGVMVLLGNRVPRALMAFLIALAIADDLGAVSVIAFFYTETLHYPALLAAIGFTGVLVVFNLIGIRWAIPYFFIAVLLWFAMLYSGVHATLAGIIGAFTVPARPKYDPRYFIVKTKDIMIKLDKSYEENSQVITNVNMRSLIDRIEELAHSVITPLQRLEHIWHGPVAFVVIPVFALFNAGIPLHMGILTHLTTDMVIIGIICGLVLGKLVGITFACWLAIKLKIAQLPNNTSFAQIVGAALLAGIGFTMSIFIAQLAFGTDKELIQAAKTGILAASLLSGVGGYAWLWICGNRDAYEDDSI